MGQMKINAFIFDLDGVLVSTDQLHYQAWKQVADTLGIFFDYSINNQLRGVSRMESLDIILMNYEGKPITQKRRTELAEWKNELYKRLLECLGPEDVGIEVRDTLKQLQRKGYKIAVGSSSKNAEYILKRVELFDLFDAISDGNHITRSKPDPEVFIKAAELLKEKPEDCAVIEDAYAGIDAAKSGGMLAIAIGAAVAYEEADLRILKLSDLLNYIN